MKRTTTFLVAGALFSIGASCEVNRTSGEDPILARGATLYRNSCASCHGHEGDGKGSVSPYLVTKPRDFTRASYKFRSTPTGTMPTTHDIVRTVSKGVGGTVMPPFAAMDRQDILALDAYLRFLNGKGVRKELQKLVDAGELEIGELEEVLKERLAPGEPIEIPDPPPMGIASIDRGKAVFERMECAKCHGPSGRGDGPSVPGLVDDWGAPMVPADFTLSGGIKGGSTARDVFRTFMTGMDGTPMPSYAQQLEPEEAWDLAHYVLWLRRQR